MPRDPLIPHLWLMEALGELAKHTIKAIPPKQREALVLTVLEFLLPSEKGGQAHPIWPQLVFDIWNVRPAREPTDKRWDHRIDQLIAAAQKNKPDRQRAIVQLAFLAIRDALKPHEAVELGRALWSDVDAQDNGLPANTGLNPGILLQLPAGEGIDAKARVTARLLGTNLPDVMRLAAPTGTIEVREKVDHLIALTNAAKFGFVIAPDRAAKMFDEIVAWEPQQITDGRDPFAASFAKSFNSNIGASAGYLLATVLVPALETGERTEGRARSLIAFVTRAHSWPSLLALPCFLPSTAGSWPMSYPPSAPACWLLKRNMSGMPPEPSSVERSWCAKRPCRNCHVLLSNGSSPRSRHAAQSACQPCSPPLGLCWSSVSLRKKTLSA
jgi:hypothetical protein